MALVYGNPTVVNENDIVTEAAAFRHKEFQVKDGPLALPYLVHRRADLLKQGYKVLEGFVDQAKHKQGFSTPLSSRTRLTIKP